MAKLSALFLLVALSGADASSRYLRKAMQTHTRATTTSSFPLTTTNSSLGFTVRAPVLAPSKSPAATRSPEASKSPAATRSPEATKSPAATRSPEASKSPAATRSPETTKSPAATRSPEATKSPTATRSPEATKSPAATRSPEASKSPAATRSPEATKSPAATRSPGASNSPADTRALPLPTSTTGADAVITQAMPKDLPPPETGFVEIPKMEGIPDFVLNKGTGDIVDTPTPLLDAAPRSTSGSSMSDVAPGSTSEIPAMERIPDFLLNKSAGDIVDTPTMSDVPVLETSGSAAENFVLERTASVCATSQQDAFNQCKAWPVCKYVLDRAGKPTSVVKPGQGKCVPRCDPPLGAANCGARQQCVPFVLSCVAPSWN